MCRCSKRQFRRTDHELVTQQSCAQDQASHRYMRLRDAIKLTKVQSHATSAVAGIPVNCCGSVVSDPKLAVMLSIAQRFQRPCVTWAVSCQRGVGYVGAKRALQVDSGQEEGPAEAHGPLHGIKVSLVAKPLGNSKQTLSRSLVPPVHRCLISVKWLLVTFAELH